ncbi:MAG: aldo/keto reductase, partial [Dehalococcoidia bacterium]|nr:aldo/keto reductase [Dehalococcoidia bacterium]
METRTFGKLGPVSALTLGGGGTGGVWGATTREEAVETVLAAVEGGITFLDVAPGYGNGEAERVVGEAFGGRLPEGVRISTKHHLGNVPAGEVAGTLRQALAASLDRLRLERLDLFFLHGMVVPDGFEGRGTPRSLFVEAARPAFEAMVADGTIGALAII